MIAKTVIATLKKKASGGAISILKRLQCSRLPVVEPVHIPYEGTIKGVCFFLGTKTGLIYFDGQQLWRLFEGRVYGITRYNSRWYTTWNHRVTLGEKPLSTMASIISFRFDNERITDLRVEAAPLDREVHQIDAWDGQLYVTDTAYNRVLAYRIMPEGLRYVRAYYPKGRLTDGRQSPNYAHINSVFRCGNQIYLMFHNYTRRTGRASQLAILNTDWKELQISETTADSAHNVFYDGEGIIYCDSIHGRLMRDDDTLLERDVYLRGLAVANDFYLIGGSEFARRDERGNTTGHLYQWGVDTEALQAELCMPGVGSVYEVRLSDQPDFGMSRFNESPRNHDVTRYVERLN